MVSPVQSSSLESPHGLVPISLPLAYRNFPIGLPAGSVSYRSPSNCFILPLTAGIVKQIFGKCSRHQNYILFSTE